LHPGADPGLRPQPPEQPGTGLGDDLELGLALVDAQLIEGCVLGLFDSPTGYLDPFHA
jgi:hypothetical protein